MNGSRWIVRGVLAAGLAAFSAFGISNVPAGAITGYDVTYTTDADFDLGALFNVNHTAPNSNQLQLNSTITTFPALWVANGGEDSVSKINTSLNRETARYRTWFTGTPLHGPWDGPAPSRTAVSASGDAYVLNRNFGSVTGARQSTLLKIKGSGFIDRNGNGVEDTSTDLNNDGFIQAAEMKTMGPDINGNGYPDISANPAQNEVHDERIEWITRVGPLNGVGRSLCIAPNGNVWVGLYEARQYYEIDGATGAIIGAPVNTPDSHGPYGCVIDSAGILYGATISDHIVRINTNTKTYMGRANHGGTNYGITHHNGLTYVSMLSGPRMYKTFNGAAFADGGQPSVGITAAVATDGANTLVYSGRQSGLTYKETNGVLNWSAGPSNFDTRGTIIDSDGNVWRIHMTNSTVVKYDKNTGAVLHTQPVGLSPYTYSDATGLNAITSTPAGNWKVTQDSGGAGTIWDTVRWNQEPQGSVPAGASIVVEIKAADTVAGLSLAPMVVVPSSGASLAGAVVGQYAEVTVRLTANAEQESPVLSDVRITGRAPNSPPQVTCAPVSLFTSPTSCNAPSATVGTATDPDGDTLIVTQSPEGPYGLGSTSVTFTATDPAGASASCSAAVTVVDNVPPSITCPAATTIECAGPTTMFTPAAANAADNCSVNVNGPAAGAFPLGTTSLAYTATDGSGNSTSCTSAVTVVDTTAPVITSLTNSFSSIWPPNHRMVALNLSVSATDGCAGGPINTAGACRITNITSNEAINANGDGNTDPDWIIGTGLNASLRAERQGGGSGRIYTVTVVCEDAQGNDSAPMTTTVAVPHSNGKM